MARADSSVVSVAMVGLDSRYQAGGLQLRGQLYYSAVSNTTQYNEFTALNGTPNDLGSAMAGYYLEAGYDVLNFNPRSKTELVIFTRYESYNTHFSTTSELPENKAYDNQIITSGITLKLAKGAVVKTDIRFLKSAAANEYHATFNAGVGVMF